VIYYDTEYYNEYQSFVCVCYRGIFHVFRFVSKSYSFYFEEKIFKLNPQGKMSHQIWQRRPRVAC